MNKTEALVSKYVLEAVEQIQAFNGTKDTPLEVSERLKEILTALALRCVAVSSVDKCKECEEKLDPRLKERCPKHIGMLLATDYAKGKAREHGPVIATKAVLGVQAWLEKLTASEEEPEKAP